MSRKLIKKWCVIVVCLLSVIFCACGKSDRGKVVFTTSLAKDELFRIDRVSCTLPEYMLYLVNTRNKYQEAFGEEVWNITFEGIRLEDNVKDNVLARITKMKSVYLLALDKGVTLTEGEEKMIKEAADTYFGTMSKEEAETLGITGETVLQLYRENALADKVYRQIIGQVNPEISDDEARTVTIEQIVLKTSTSDSQGQIIPYSKGMREDALKKLTEIREMAITGEQSFTELAGKYSEEENIRVSLKKGEAQEWMEEVVFRMETDEISEVIEGTNGYYLLKCINTFDRTQTDANKLVIIEKRKNEAFSIEYDAFVSKLARKLNEKLWNKIQLKQAINVKSQTFFEVYEACLEKF